MNQQAAQVAIAALADPQHLGTAAGGGLYTGPSANWLS